MIHTVHPHLRGEYSNPLSKIIVRGGSSPLAWGILTINLILYQPFRFIPTCVGNTKLEYPCYLFISGSSPLAWGILLTQHVFERGQSVHPHLRGEYNSRVSIVGRGHGSSPLAWGIPRDMALSYSRNRFIPTCVGNTDLRNGTHERIRGSSPLAWGIRLSATAAICLTTVHPHLRGEYAISIISGIVKPAVHPHLRGEYTTTISDSTINARFIPTCVGNTQCVNLAICVSRGSSPLAWGIRLLPLVHLEVFTVHPHLRGEYLRRLR